MGESIPLVLIDGTGDDMAKPINKQKPRTLACMSCGGVGDDEGLHILSSLYRERAHRSPLVWINFMQPKQLFLLLNVNACNLNPMMKGKNCQNRNVWVPFDSSRTNTLARVERKEADKRP